MMQLYLVIYTLKKKYFPFISPLYWLGHYIDFLKQIAVQVGYILCEFISIQQENIAKYFKIQYLNPHPTNYWLHRSLGIKIGRFTKVPEFLQPHCLSPNKNSNTTFKKKPVLLKYRICMVKSTNLVHSSMIFQIYVHIHAIDIRGKDREYFQHFRKFSVLLSEIIIILSSSTQILLTAESLILIF